MLIVCLCLATVPVGLLDSRMFTIIIETGITIETGVFIGNVVLPVNNITTQDGNWLVTQSDDAIVT